MRHQTDSSKALAFDSFNLFGNIMKTDFNMSDGSSLVL